MRSFGRSPPALVAALAIAVGMLGASAARAAGVLPIEATPAQKQAASAHFVAGKAALDARELERAVLELRASLEVVDSPNARLELARALRDAGNFAEAWREYGRTVEVAGQLAPREPRYAATMEAASAEGRDQERHLALVVVEMGATPPDATLKVADRIVPRQEWGAPIVAPPGVVRIACLQSDGAEIAHRTVTAVVGRVTAVDLEPAETKSPRRDPALPEKPQPPGETRTLADEPAEESPAPAPPGPGHAGLRPFAYAAAGFGVAGLATFAVSGALSSETYNDLKSTCPQGCLPGRRAEIDRGIAEQTAANVGLGVGLVGLAVGTTLFVLSLPPSSAKPSSALVLAPSPQGAFVAVRGSL